MIKPIEVWVKCVCVGGDICNHGDKHVFLRKIALISSFILVAGQERYRSMTSSYYRGAHGCLIMFDVTKESSFENLDSW